MTNRDQAVLLALKVNELGERMMDQLKPLAKEFADAGVEDEKIQSVLVTMVFGQVFCAMALGGLKMPPSVAHSILEILMRGDSTALSIQNMLDAASRNRKKES